MIFAINFMPDKYCTKTRSMFLRRFLSQSLKTPIFLDLNFKRKARENTHELYVYKNIKIPSIIASKVL